MDGTLGPTDYWTGHLDPRTPLTFPGGVCFFDCRRAGRHLRLPGGVHFPAIHNSGRRIRVHPASGFLTLLYLDAAFASTRRPISSLFSIWTPHSHPHGVRFPLSSLFGRHTIIPLASILQLSIILDAASSLTWRPIPNAQPFWTPPSISPGVRFPPTSLFGRHTIIPLASIPQLSTILDATITDATITDATITDATSASQWRPVPKVASRRQIPPQPQCIFN